jgi:elongation factor Ts
MLPGCVVLIITSRVASDAKSGILLEINCETDFVSRNDNFQAFVADIADTVAASKAADLDAALAVQKGDINVGDFVKAKVVELGENIQFRKYVRFDAAPGGVVVSYIHMGGKVGVLLEVGTTKDVVKIRLHRARQALRTLLDAPMRNA